MDAYFEQYWRDHPVVVATSLGILMSTVAMFSLTELWLGWFGMD